MEFQQAVVTFESTHHAIKGEKILKSHDIDHKMIPTPRGITRSCGLSAKFNIKDFNAVKELFTVEEVAMTGIYKKLKNNDFEKIEG